MTVTSGTSRVTYAGDGVTVLFTVPFYFLANDHLAVIKRDTAGTETTLVLNSDYTVSGAGNPAGGSITTTVAPANGEKLAIIRAVPFTQETDYKENDPFPAETHERAIDKNTMMAQQVRDSVGRTLVLGETDTDGSGSYRAKGNKIADLGTPTLGPDATNKSYVDAALAAAGIPSGLLTVLDFSEITPPASPAADVARVFAKDVAGVTRLFVKDSVGLETDLHIPPDGSVTTAKIGDDQVTNTKLANVATRTFKGRAAALTGDPEDMSVATAAGMFNDLTEETAVDGAADFLFGYDASAAAARKFKPNNLPGGATLIAETTISVAVASVDFTDIPQTYASLLVALAGVSHNDASSRSLIARISTDNGSSYDATGYTNLSIGTGGAIDLGSDAMYFHSALISAAVALNAAMVIHGYTATAFKLARAAASNAVTKQFPVVSGSTSPINALRVLASVGSLDAGTIRLYGLR